YDTYPTGSPAAPTAILGQALLPPPNPGISKSTQSLPTASFVKNIEDDSWTKTYLWYDKKGRAIGTHSINHLGGYTRTESLLDFSGVPQETYTFHKRLSGDPVVTVKQRFEYDSQLRLKEHYHQVNSASEILLAEY